MHIGSMKRNRSPDVEESPARKRVRGARPGGLAGTNPIIKDSKVAGLCGAGALTSDGRGLRADAAHTVSRAPVIDLAGSCSKHWGGHVDEDEEDFCEFVSEVVGTSGPASGKLEKPWWDLTSDSDDESCYLCEMETVDDSDASTSAATENAATGPSTSGAAVDATPTAAAAAAAATVAAATATAAKTLRRRLSVQQAAPAAVAAADSLNSGASCPCPGCLPSDQDAVRKYNMKVAEMQLCADVSTARLPPPDPDGDPCVAVLTGGDRCCTDCRCLAALAVVEAAQKRVLKIVGQHSKASLGTMQGFVFEVHHAASFNIAAIRAGSLLRAECMEFAYADVRVYNVLQPAATLAMAQLKASRKRKTLDKLDQRKYAELLKVVPKGMEAPARGRRSALSYGGISSSPIDLHALKLAVLQPGVHFFELAWAAGP